MKAPLPPPGLGSGLGARRQVAGAARGWAEGELTIFDDSFEHSVVHA